VTPGQAAPGVLIVDDEPLNRAVLEHLLNSNGINTIQGKNGQEAIALSTDPNVKIDLILLDISMPDINGIQVLRLLRQVRSQMELPIIMVTSADDNAQLVEAFRNGANDYITKPIEPQVTLARIDSQLKLKHAQSALRDSEERYALASRGTNDGLWDWNLATGEIYFSERWKTMLGLPEHQPIDQFSDWVAFMHPEDVIRVQDDLETHLCGESEQFQTELRLLHQEEGYRWMLCRGLAVRNRAGSAVRIAGSLTDITDGKVADALTGLPNRLLFQDRVQRCLDQARRYPSRKFAVLYLDVDGFKLINDNYGHEAGDRFLVQFARRLETSVRNCDSAVSRLGGDEFAVLVENMTDYSSAEAVADRILEVLEAPFQVGGTEFFARASIGISTISDRGNTAAEVLREADTAMYFAKKNVHVPFKYFSPELNAETLARLELSSELRRALEQEELVLHYQPIVETDSYKIAGFEALIRWESARLGTVLPDQFIPVAEETGLIVPIGEWVLQTACETMHRLRDDNLPSPMISVNVSIKQLDSEGFVESVLRVLETTGFEPSRLKLEVTESVVMEDPEQAIKRLELLRAAGVTIGLDDFGTGYSSLAYLHHLPLNILKIDRSFVSQMVETSSSFAIVKTIARLADSLDLDVIAEGVETEQQLTLLEEMGCRYSQGYLFSQAVPESEIRGLLEKHGRA
jgi:diguanylate cyclase (GGDEF)-like protein/PAS domain S-box-containing protein